MRIHIQDNQRKYTNSSEVVENRFQRFDTFPSLVSPFKKSYVPNGRISHHTKKSTTNNVGPIPSKWKNASGINLLMNLQTIEASSSSINYPRLKLPSLKNEISHIERINCQQEITRVDQPKCMTTKSYVVTRSEGKIDIDSIGRLQTIQRKAMTDIIMRRIRNPLIFSLKARKPSGDGFEIFSLPLEVLNISTTLAHIASSSRKNSVT